jgi:RND family efflux transporter MFP subunit
MKSAMAGLALMSVLTACSGGHDTASTSAQPELPAGEVGTLEATPFQSVFSAAGTAEPIAQATLSTKLMGTVMEVYVREGDVVTRGQRLLRIDARDLSAKSAQVEAGIAEAEAMLHEARTTAARIRALYAQDAAPKAQLDAVETGVARAEAAVRAAQAGAVELTAIRDYSIIRAPSAGTITRRMVDPGAFAAPGAPLITVQNAGALRIRAHASPDVVRGIVRGTQLPATIEGVRTTALVEGVVPAAGGNMYVVNAVVRNDERRFMPGSAATLSLPLQTRTAVTVPASAIVREGDLTGLYIKAGERFVLRWVRLGEFSGESVEILAGATAGDQVLLAPTIVGAR